MDDISVTIYGIISVIFQTDSERRTKMYYSYIKDDKLNMTKKDEIRCK